MEAVYSFIKSNISIIHPGNRDSEVVARSLQLHMKGPGFTSKLFYDFA